MLINNLEASPTLAAQMRSNPEETVPQLGRSVCSNAGFRTLMAQGATLRYSFREYKTNSPVLIQISALKTVSAKSKSPATPYPVRRMTPLCSPASFR